MHSLCMRNFWTSLLSFTQKKSQQCILAMWFPSFSLGMQFLQFLKLLICIFNLCLIILSSFNYKGYSSIVTSFINISHVFSLILFSFLKDFLNFQFSQDNVTKGVGKNIPLYTKFYQQCTIIKKIIKKFLCSH